MPRKKIEPVLTHCEVICYAIRYLEADIHNWSVACDGLPDAEERLMQICERQFKHLSALKQMYHFETGSEYC